MIAIGNKGSKLEEQDTLIHLPDSSPVSESSQNTAKQISRQFDSTYDTIRTCKGLLEVRSKMVVTGFNNWIKKEGRVHSGLKINLLG